MKKLIMGLLLFGLLASLAGCSKDKNQEESRKEGTFRIYYLNSTITKLEPEKYAMPSKPEDFQGTQTDWQLSSLMQQLVEVPKDLDRQAAVPDKVGFEGYKLEDKVLYLSFDSNYAMMDSTREILCRASLVKTLTQVEDVKYVAIYVADQPLMDNQGTPVGPMAGSDFIEDISNVNSFEKMELVLYFADPTGEKLVRENREVFHNVNTSMEKLVVDQLIAGPWISGMNPTLPKDTKLLNVSVNDNICYLNFDSSFLNNTLDVKEYIPIYSIVNSLAAVSTVNKVQITVNGSQDVMLRDSMSLNRLFERNLDYNMENESAAPAAGGN